MQPVPEGVYRHKINREKPTHDTKGDNMENNKEKRIIFATGNAGKMREIRAILSDLGLPVLSMKEAGVVLNIVEDGKTFAENAKIKAMAVWKQTGGIVLADDSGLAVDYIGGEPVFTLPDIWEKIPLMRSKTEISLSVWQMPKEKNAVPVLSVTLPLS